ncbi:MAG: HDIG domain-containing protein [Acidimicrobiales bacterium]|nr:HDIG domain-containing protein [Acidimicrobiales bacterium]RZV48488.1 MAG: HDIG domain-containing protein [Acidimicrobiales bacterium]
MSASPEAEELAAILAPEDPTPSLWSAFDSGRMDDLAPELALLRMEQDPIHRHKDVLAHTVAVVGKTKPDLRIRLGALFHDVGKPRTRRIDSDGVTFRHHEAVGARMTRKRLTALGFPEDMVDTVCELVRMSGRFKGYSDGWSDSAVRRYAREAGPLLGDLNHLIRCDCTTRNKQKAAGIQAAMDDLERRIAELAEADRRAAERPDMDGSDVMAYLDIPPGPAVGEAVRMLLEIKRAEGQLDRGELESRLDAWWAERTR